MSANTKEVIDDPFWIILALIIALTIVLAPDGSWSDLWTTLWQ